MQIKRWKIVIILLLMSLSVGMLVYSFAFTTVNNIGESTNYLTVSEIMFNYRDAKDTINLINQVPSIDKFGLLNDPFTFSITNDENKDRQYTIRLIDGENVSTIKNSSIRYQLGINDVYQDIKYLAESGVIDSGSIKGGETRNYTIRLWLSENSEDTNGLWDKIIKVEAGTTNIDFTGANEPKLIDGMIPVYYDYASEVWRKADSTNSNINYMWYDYASRIWANVVTVRENVRDKYANSVPGIEIDMEDINSMWVWIPRFKYEIFNALSKNMEPTNIKITFERGNKNTSSVLCTKDECHDTVLDKIENQKSTYTPSSFTFGDLELTGFWMSKFNTSLDDGNLVIKPNNKTLTNVNVQSLFLKFRQMELKNNIYGFTNEGLKVNNDGSIVDDNNDFDTHMIRNSEWTSVVYLSHSIYGKYGDDNYKNKEIYLSNPNTTGSSYGDSILSLNAYTYEVLSKGEGSSSTGNIYGVYDLNTSLNTFVMANINDDEEFKNDKKTGFTDIYPLSKYYDSYAKEKFNSLINNGFYETKNWYNDQYTKNNGSFITRGYSSQDEKSGVFGISIGDSWDNKTMTSRPTIIVKDNVYITKW